MYCSECGNKIDINSKFCSNCGKEQTFNKEEIKKEEIKKENPKVNLENEKKSKKATILFTIFRTMLELIIVMGNFLIHEFTEVQATLGGFIAVILISAIVNMLGIMILNKFIKLKQFSQYVASNGASYVLCTVISYIILFIYLDLADVRGSTTRFGYFMMLILAGFLIKPVIVIENLIMDRIIWKKNTKKLEE